MSFGENNEELSITWTADLRVITRPGKFFEVPSVQFMVGEENFTATDFEVLQPHGNIFATHGNQHFVNTVKIFAKKNGDHFRSFTRMTIGDFPSGLAECWRAPLKVNIGG